MQLVAPVPRVMLPAGQRLQLPPAVEVNSAVQGRHWLLLTPPSTVSWVPAEQGVQLVALALGL